MQRGITMVSLVITIIILIILAGITMNTLIGDNGIILKTKQAKENMALAQEEEAKNLNQLYDQLSDVNGNINTGDSEAVEKLLAFKKVIAQAITKEGVSTKETDSAEVMVSNIEKILAQRTKDATATAEDITQGKTAWVNGNKIAGIVTNKTYNIPSIELIAGYDNNVSNSANTVSKIDCSGFSSLHIGSIVGTGFTSHATVNKIVVTKIVNEGKENVYTYTIKNTTSCNVTDILDIDIHGADYVQISANIVSAGGTTNGRLTIGDIKLY
ncbi:MAG: hypothetical protein ACLTEH_00140 [Clostridia bacterium]